jgi:hypothetical protein
MNSTFVFATLGALALMGVGGWVIGSEHAEHHGWFADSRMLAQDLLFRAECGSCHLAYPPGLLPAASWQRIMIRLEGHFGDDASLDPATAAQGNFDEHGVRIPGVGSWHD